MNLAEHLLRMRELAEKAAGEATMQIRVPAANALRGNIINRIQNQGVGSDGGKIGSYSRKPAYYSKRQFVKKGAFKPAGKSGADKFKNGLPHKSMYVPGGYGQLRDIQGRQSGYVDGTYSGDMMLDYQQQVTTKETLLGFTKEKESVKRKAFEQRFKPVFRATTQEVQDYNKECAAGYAGLTLKILGR